MIRTRNWFDWRRLIVALSTILASTVVCGSGLFDQYQPSEGPQTTYEKFLPFGVAGDSSIQHLLGYMFFYGEGVEQGFDDAVYWFKAAAEEGDYRAQRNLGLIYAGAVESIPARFYDPAAANLWLSLAAANLANPDYMPQAVRASEKFLPVSADATRSKRAGSKDGEDLYQANCAGCHGFDGHGAYPAVPSFADGEGLSTERSIAESFHTRFNWNSTLPRLDPESRRRLAAYIRQQFGGPSAESTSTGKPALSASMLIDKPAPAATSVPDKLPEVEEIYLRFCGGCHGFNGIAWYVNSPSFALNERLHKSDAELAHSIRQGMGVMPSWEYLLKPTQIEALVGFIRTLAARYESGIVSDLHRPEQFLRFRPDSEAADDPR